MAETVLAIVMVTAIFIVLTGVIMGFLLILEALSNLEK